MISQAAERKVSMKRQSEQKDDGTMQREVERIQQYAGEYDVVPIKKEIFADVITPISLLRRLAVKHRRFYMLESVEGGEKLGR